MSWHKRLLSQDLEAGYREWYWSNPDDGKVALQTEWLVKPIAEDAKAHYAMVDERAPWKGTFHHVAYIPRWVQEYEYRVNKRTLADKEFWRDWANRAENRGFRTRPGRV